MYKKEENKTEDSSLFNSAVISVGAGVTAFGVMKGIIGKDIDTSEAILSSCAIGGIGTLG